MNSAQIKQLALECGFDLAGLTPALPIGDASLYQDWVRAGMAGAMGYLADYRAERRMDPRSLLASAKSILCVAQLYSGPEPYSTEFNETDRGWISRYAWGDDYHDVLRGRLERVAGRLREHDAALEYKVCVDTAPLLERSYARMAGLGWIGKNTCLIHPAKGSWFFLGELLLSWDVEADEPQPDRCGSCTACIDACPTDALTPYWLDARRCISYLTIELKGSVPEELRQGIGAHLFGCDICQDVCPWNRRPALATEPSFASRRASPSLARMAALTEAEFRNLFKGTPVSRARYRGFLRNVAVAIGNSSDPRLMPALHHLAMHEDALVADHAMWALSRRNTTIEVSE